ncbi:IPT/TIG domain-containing protein [Cellulomonas sp. KRMCY2]|uniref:IPT/TIG domain-containing protein n=1 Tax=Cellulomonas sp. KRMCY2 TaxID=1304865 RepID=UPI00045E8BC3|nr:IPT/TIG domain-containing protein [Cellulomonas sp. KRMCY2]
MAPAPDSGGPAPAGTAPVASTDTPTQASAAVTQGSRYVVGFFVLIAVVGLISALLAAARGQNAGREWALFFAFAVVAAGLGLTHVLGGAERYGIFRPLIGADNRFSTSKTQAGLWTVLVVTGFAWLLGVATFAGADLAMLMPEDRWDAYLILLGGPFAAAVLAKGIVEWKVENGTLQKTSPAQTTVSQIATDDKGSADLVDSQYLLFNVVAMGYFVVRLTVDGVLPEMPSSLLALTGLTAATFVANKAAQRNRPTITSVSPKTPARGETVTIFGTNFDPTGPATRPDPNTPPPQADSTDVRWVTVTLDGYTRAIDVPPADYSDTQVSFLVPSSAELGKRAVFVTSTAGVQTQQATIEIKEAKSASDPAVDGSALAR